MAKTRIDIQTSGSQQAQKQIATVEDSLRSLEDASRDVADTSADIFSNKGAADFLKRVQLARQGVGSLSKSYKEFGNTVVDVSKQIENAELTNLISPENTEAVLEDLQRIVATVEEAGAVNLASGFEDRAMGETLDLVREIEEATRKAATAAEDFQFPQETLDKFTDRMRELVDLVDENTAPGPEGGGLDDPVRVGALERLQQFGGTNARLSRSLSGIGGNFGIAPLQGIGDFLALGDDLPEIISGFAELRGVLLASTLVLGSISVLYAAAKHEIAEANQVLNQWVRTLPQLSAATFDYFQILTEGTRATEEALRQEAEIKQQLLQEQVKTLETFMGQYDDALAQRFGGPGAQVLKLLGADADDVKNRVKELNTALQDNAATLNYLNSEMVQNNLAMNQFVEDLRAARDAQIEIANLIAFASSEELERRKKELGINIAASESSITSIESKIVELFRTAEEQQWGTIMDPAIDSFIELEKYLEETVGQFYNVDLAALSLQDKLGFLASLMGEDFSVQMATLTEEAITASEELEKYRSQMEQLNQEVEPQVAAREREEEILQKATEAEEERTQVLEELASIEKQINDLYEERAKQQANDQQIKNLEDFHKAQLDAIDARIAEAEAMEKYQARQKELKELDDETRDKRVDIDKKFLTDSLKRSKEFIREEKIITDKANLERLRALEDLQDDLTRLASDNDFAGFIERQREGIKDLSRSDQDVKEETRLRREEFDIQQREARDAHDQELADLVQYYVERRDQIIASYQDEFTVVEQLQQQREALVLRQQAQMEQLRQVHEREAFLDRIRDLQDQQEILRGRFQNLNSQIAAAGATLGANAGNAVLGGFFASVTGQLNRLQSLYQRANATPNVQSRVSSPDQRYTRTAFAKGGIADRPTMGLFGEDPRYNELFMPFKKSEGLAAALQQNFGPMLGARGTGTQFHFDFSGTNFGSLTRDDVENAIERAMRRVVAVVESRP